MSLIMTIKQFLRSRGYDVVKYHSFWDDVAAPRGIQTILDIGANEGVFVRSMRKRFPHARIISFEPLRDCYETLISVMAGDTNFEAHHTALGEHPGQTVIHRSASHPSSSLLPMDALHKELYPGSAEHQDETITVERLDTVLGNVDLKKPILVKIDVQGFEANVIRGGSAVLSKADIVLVENSFVTLYEGQALFGEIHDLLTKLGFSYRGRSETHYNTKTKEPLYEDSIFIRN